MRKRGLVAAAVLGLVLAGGLLLMRPSSRPHDSDNARAPGSFARAGGAAPSSPPPLEGSVGGRVSSADQRPVAAATVCAVGADRFPPPPACAVTDLDGSYILAVPPGRHAVTASAPDFRPAVFHDGARAWLAVPAGARRTGVDIVLERGGAPLRGHVRDIGGGPIAGALVLVRATAAPEAPPASAHSDEQGSWRLWADAGAVSCEASAPGYANGSATGLSPSSDLELVLTPESALVGRVVDARSGAPVAGARVEADGTEDTDELASGGTETDATGRFRIGGLTPARYVITASTAAGYGRGAESVRLGVGETSREITVALHEAVPVSGSIVDTAGQPCPGGLVWLSNARLRRTIRGRVAPDRDGVTVGVVPGRYDVTARCTERGDASPQPPVVVADVAVSGLVWRVSGGQTIAGAVVTPDGVPVSGLAVCAAGAGSAPSDCGVSGADGGFRFADVPPGSYEVAVADQGDPQGALRVDLAPGRSVLGLRLVVAAGLCLQGVVVSEDGSPVPGAYVVITSPRQEPQTTRARPDGGFAFARLEAGAHRVFAARGLPQAASAASDDDGGPGQLVQITAGAPARVRIVLPRARSRITGRVLEAGKPVGDAFVAAAREPEATVAQPPSGAGKRRCSATETAGSSSAGWRRAATACARLAEVVARRRSRACRRARRSPWRCDRRLSSQARSPRAPCPRSSR
jgi:hypothetical protein